MNTRAIHIRLILWYSGLVVLISLAFGAYVYNGLQVRLYGEMQRTLTRRAKQIAENILSRVPPEKPEAIATQIHDVYSPEASNRFIRISRTDQSIVYVSGAPKDNLFDTNKIALPKNPHGDVHVETFHKTKIMIVVVPADGDGQHYLIEMGAVMDDPEIALHGLALTLLFGLPMVVLIASAGGYILVRRALKPVEDIRATAQRITFGNLRNRLPVATTGDALEHLSVTLNQMLDRLEAAYEQASRFSADASHELRTPLTIMRSELEGMVREDSVPISLRERISSVLEEAERLSRIAENLFTISRLDAGEGKAQHVKFDLAALARNTAEQMVLLADEKQVKLHIQTPYPVFIYGDASRMKQLVVNLLDNAIKYTPEGGAVRLYVGVAHEKAVLEVADTGVGIPAEALPHVFDRFYRADKVRSRDMGGAGLGLSIVRSICQAHGGTVEIESKEGEGTLCHVEISLAGEQEMQS